MINDLAWKRACASATEDSQSARYEDKCETAPTFHLRFDEVEHLAEAVLERKGLDGHGLQFLTLIVVEVLQLIHAEHPVPVQVHTAEPVLYAAKEKNTISLENRKKDYTVSAAKSQNTWCQSSCLPQKWGTKQNQRSLAFPPYTPVCPWWQQQQIKGINTGSVHQNNIFWYSTHLVTVPENILSINFWEMAAKHKVERSLTTEHSLSLSRSPNNSTHVAPFSFFPVRFLWQDHNSRWSSLWPHSVRNCSRHGVIKAEYIRCSLIDLVSYVPCLTLESSAKNMWCEERGRLIYFTGYGWGANTVLQNSPICPFKFWRNKKKCHKWSKLMA